MVPIVVPVGMLMLKHFVCVLVTMAFRQVQYHSCQHQYPAQQHQQSRRAVPETEGHGSTDADMYTRARVALEGLLALGRDETMYYMARHDDLGQPLRSACSYRVEGLPPPARWWSITAYADDLFLFDAPNRQYSLNDSTARLDASGRFALVTGHKAMEGWHWLPTPGQRGLVLTLRLYNPGSDLQAAPERLLPPSIKAIGACP